MTGVAETTRCRYCFAPIPAYVETGRTRRWWRAPVVGIDGTVLVEGGWQETRERRQQMFCNDEHRRALRRSWDRPNDPDVVHSGLVGYREAAADGEQGALL